MLANRINGIRRRKKGLRWAGRLLGAFVACASLVQPASAQDMSWKQNFAACAGNSPFIESLLTNQSDQHRPLMRIGNLQAWAIRNQAGEPAVALTTDDGLTIIGTILGPQGEDISAALLATVPDRNFASLTSQPSNSGATLPDPSTSGQTGVATNGNGRPVQGATIVPDIQQAAQLQNTLPAPVDQSVGNPSSASPSDVVTAPIAPDAAPSPELQTGMNTIFEQATNERIWFSATTPGPNAPVIYMLTDPECPHCQWTIDQLHNQIVSGAIDLRIIFTPVTGVEGFNAALSILHSENIPQVFLSHMTSKTRGTEAVRQMDVNAADRAVVQGIVNNINWMRANRMPGVPFFLYQTDDGARFAFSELPSDILSIAKPL